MIATEWNAIHLKRRLMDERPRLTPPRRSAISDFQLPADLRFNRAIVQDPMAYAKESGSVSCLFLVGDEFAPMPGGISYAQIQQAVPHAARAVSNPPRALTLELARQHVEVLDRPCRSD